MSRPASLRTDRIMSALIRPPESPLLGVDRRGCGSPVLHEVQMFEAKAHTKDAPRKACFSSFGPYLCTECALAPLANF
jgi:hypothetical protein